MLKQAKALMRAEYESFVDPITGILNTTLMTEWVADRLECYEENFEIPEELFDVAVDVDEELTKAGLVQPII